MTRRALALNAAAVALGLAQPLPPSRHYEGRMFVAA